MRISFTTLFLAVAFLVPSLAQQDVFASPRPVYSPDVEYPAEAKAAGIQGSVVIRINIDGAGKVTNATLVSGHPLLSRDASIRLTFGTPAVTPAPAPANAPPLSSAVALPTASPLNVSATADGDKVIGALKWEIREEATGQILARGDGPIHLKDVAVRDSGPIAPRRQTPKIIQLTKEFVIEMAEFPVANVSEKQGFGIVGRKTDIQSFSWEWFNIQDNKHAGKLQEGGELGIELQQVGTDWEITKTEFTTDVSLRIIRLGTDPPGSPPYWRINISKGSSITWPSIVNGRVVPN
jgi:TonB family protein